MGYLKIPNLYKDTDILLFRECYALEKIHGTSTHIAYRPGEPLKFFSGGVQPGERFVEIFDDEILLAKFDEHVGAPCIVFGEGYGGKIQAMGKVYGPELRFVAFDVKIGECWLDVPKAQTVALHLGLDFVDFWKVPTDLDVLDELRDRPSTLGRRNGIETTEPGEGIVLRPLIEVKKNNGARVIAKHKSAAFRETRSVRKVRPVQAEKLREAEAIAAEWVTPMRLSHILDKMPGDGVEQTGDVIKAMILDIEAEAGDEIESSREARKAIGKAAVRLFHQHLRDNPRG